MPEKPQKPKICCFFKDHKITGTPPDCYGSPAVCPSIACSGCKWLDKGCPELTNAYREGFEQGKRDGAKSEKERILAILKKNILPTQLKRIKAEIEKMMPEKPKKGKKQRKNKKHPERFANWLNGGSLGCL